MARVRIAASVSGGTLPARLRIRWALLRLVLASRHMTAYEARTLFNALITEAEARGLEARVTGTIR